MQPPSPTSIESTEQAAALFAPSFAGHDREQLRAAHLDEQRCLIALRLHRGGGPSMFELPLREIVLEALTLGSRGLILAHSHPSGDPTPSRADIAATRVLAELTGALGIRVYDHLIFAAGAWRSLMEMGLL